MPQVMFCGIQRDEYATLRKLGFRYWADAPLSYHLDKYLPVGCLVWGNKSYEIQWRSQLELHDVRFAVGPKVRSADHWAPLEHIYKDTALRVAEGTVVRVCGHGVAQAIPRGYMLAPDISIHFDPWEYIGRRVWLVGPATPRKLWERYCELRVVGAEVLGVLITGLRAVRRAPVVIGGDLRTHMLRDHFTEDRLVRSMATISAFWAAAGDLYDGRCYSGKCLPQDRSVGEPEP